MRKWVNPSAGLLTLVCVYLALALAYGAATPDLEAPDAGGHWQYVAYLHEHWALPVFTNETAAISHELVQQPPLYYALTALLTAGQPVEASSILERNSANPYYRKGLSQRATFTHWDASPAALGPLRVARGATLAGGLLTVIFTWLLVWTLFPRQGWLALAVASVVALNPQFLFMSTAITNDLWAAALAVAAVWVAALAATQPARQWLWVAAGVLCGLATLTKYSGLFTLLPVGLLVVWPNRQAGWRGIWQAGARVGIGFLVVSGPLFWYNWQQTGELIPTAAMQQLLPGLVRPTPLAGAALWEKVSWLRRSYTGVFGYGVLAPGSYYLVVDGLLWLGGIGLLVMGMRWLWRYNAQEARAALVAGAWFGATGLGLLAWLRTMQASEQGRLLFTAAPALALLLVLGWRAFLPRRWEWLLLAAVPLGMVGLGIWQINTVQAAYATPATLTEPISPDRSLDAHFEGGMHVLGIDLPGGAALGPGQPLTATIFFDADRPIDGFYTLFLHLADSDNRLLYQYDGVPVQGRHPTAQWRPGAPFAETFVITSDVLTDTLALLSLGFYPFDRPSERLAVRDASAAKIGDRLPLAQVRVHSQAPQPEDNQDPPVARWQEGIELAQAQLSLDERKQVLGANLKWHARQPVHTAYTVFLQALDEQGNVVAQVDQEPQGGGYPTSTWGAGDEIADTLRFPAPPADWAQIIVGLYDATGQRLPLAADGAGDYYVVAVNRQQFHPNPLVVGEKGIIMLYFGQQSFGFKMSISIWAAHTRQWK